MSAPLDVAALASGPLNPFTVVQGVRGFNVLFEGMPMSEPFQQEGVARDVCDCMNAAYNAGFAAGAAMESSR